MCTHDNYYIVKIATDVLTAATDLYVVADIIVS